MSDWIIEISVAAGQGRAETRAAEVLDIDNPELAKVVGIEMCLKWADEDGSPIPRAALEYFQAARRSGGLMVWEVLTELEKRWGITSTIKNAEQAEPVGVPSKPQ